MSKLYLMMGAPGSGKTTLAKKIFPSNVKYISRDEIRYSYLQDGDEYFSYEDGVYREFVDRIAAALNEGEGLVVADQTSLNFAARLKLLDALKDRCTRPDKVIVIYVKRPLEQILEFNNKRTGRERVPEKAVRSMYEKIRVPASFEGIDELHTYNAETDTFTIKKFFN